MNSVEDDGDEAELLLLLLPLLLLLLLCCFARFSLAIRGSMLSKLRFSQPRFVLKVAKANLDFSDRVIYSKK